MKKVRKKLKNKFAQNKKDYATMGGVRDWLIQCGLKGSDKQVAYLIKLNDGCIFYPYQEADRLKILKRLKND